MPAPILLFTYNRPVHTQKTIDALLQNELSDESELYIFSDGFKAEEDRKEVEEVRNIIHAVHGFKSVHIEEELTNKGLAASVIDGVTSIVNRYGKVIVLEDDLITSPYFLTFMNEALNRFENDEKIGHIHGFCYPDLGLPDAFLIKWTGSWGWATWSRAWKFFNSDGYTLLEKMETNNRTKEFDFNSAYPYTRMLRRQIKGENDSWAIRWNASLFLHGILSVNAGRSLVQNIGFDGSGTHSGAQEIYTTKLAQTPLSIDIETIAENLFARIAFEKYYRKTNSLFAKAMRRLRRFFM